MTILEILTVLILVGILALLAVSTLGFPHSASRRTMAEGEIKMLSTALDAYQSDRGKYPRTSRTDRLDPRLHFASEEMYAAANLDLYSELTGDFLPTGR